MTNVTARLRSPTRVMHRYQRRDEFQADYREDGIETVRCAVVGIAHIPNTDAFRLLAPHGISPSRKQPYPRGKDAFDFSPLESIETRFREIGRASCRERV